MAGRFRSGRRGSKGLTPGDEELWNAYAKQVKPLQSNKPVTKRPDSTDRATDSRETIAPQRNRHAPAVQQEKPPKDPPTRRHESQLQPAALDSRQVRRIKSGRKTIDARLDLHGMRQRQAYEALRRFLFAAAAKGFQTVLIITGKGGPPTPDAGVWSGGDGSQRGVLKRMVPLWLSGPELGGLVVSFGTAHVRHGGEGAIYVRLRRGQRGKRT